MVVTTRRGSASRLRTRPPVGEEFGRSMRLGTQRRSACPAAWVSLPSKNGRAPPFLVHSYKGGSECEEGGVAHRVGNEHRIVPDPETSTRPNDRSDRQHIGFISFDVNGSLAGELKGLVHGGDVSVCLEYDKEPPAQVASNPRLRAYLKTG